MQLPGAVSLAFLAVLLVLLPLGARRTARATSAARKAGPEPPNEAGPSATHEAAPGVTRAALWRSAIYVQLVLFILAWFTAAGLGYRIFAVDGIGPIDVLFACGALALTFGIREALRRTRTEEERRGLSVYRRAPRTPGEVRLFVAVALLAGVAEEAAYRGVAWAILTYSLGSAWIGAVILSGAFAFAHWQQGWKSLVAILLIAFVMHALVWLTGTLVLAMIVHATYDLIAGWRIRRAAAAFDAA